MRKLINAPADVVPDALRGLAAAHPSLRVEAGAGLAEVAAAASEVNERTRSFGVALSPCTVPAAGEPTFDLGEDEMELGIGIHGEPGRERTKLQTAAEIVDAALSAIHADMSLSGAETLLLVNGMGG